MFDQFKPDRQRRQRDHQPGLPIGKVEVELGIALGVAPDADYAQLANAILALSKEDFEGKVRQICAAKFAQFSEAQVEAIITSMWSYYEPSYNSQKRKIDLAAKVAKPIPIPAAAKQLFDWRNELEETQEDFEEFAQALNVLRRLLDIDYLDQQAEEPRTKQILKLVDPSYLIEGAKASVLSEFPSPLKYETHRQFHTITTRLTEIQDDLIDSEEMQRLKLSEEKLAKLDQATSTPEIEELKRDKAKLDRLNQVLKYFKEYQAKYQELIRVELTNRLETAGVKVNSEPRRAYILLHHRLQQENDIVEARAALVTIQEMFPQLREPEKLDSYRDLMDALAYYGDEDWIDKVSVRLNPIVDKLTERSPQFDGQELVNALIESLFLSITAHRSAVLGVSMITEKDPNALTGPRVSIEQRQKDFQTRLKEALNSKGEVFQVSLILDTLLEIAIRSAGQDRNFAKQLVSELKIQMSNMLKAEPLKFLSKKALAQYEADLATEIDPIKKGEISLNMASQANTTIDAALTSLDQFAEVTVNILYNHVFNIATQVNTADVLTDLPNLTRKQYDTLLQMGLPLPQISDLGANPPFAPEDKPPYPGILDDVYQPTLRFNTDGTPVWRDLTLYVDLDLGAEDYRQVSDARKLRHELDYLDALYAPGANPAEAAQRVATEYLGFPANAADIENELPAPPIYISVRLENRIKEVTSLIADLDAVLSDKTRLAYPRAEVQRLRDLMIEAQLMVMREMISRSANLDPTQYDPDVQTKLQNYVSVLNDLSANPNVDRADRYLRMLTELNEGFKHGVHQHLITSALLEKLSSFAPHVKLLDLTYQDELNVITRFEQGLRTFSPLLTLERAEKVLVGYMGIIEQSQQSTGLDLDQIVDYELLTRELSDYGLEDLSEQTEFQALKESLKGVLQTKLQLLSPALRERLVLINNLIRQVEALAKLPPDIDEQIEKTRLEAIVSELSQSKLDYRHVDIQRSLNHLIFYEIDRKRAADANDLDLFFNQAGTPDIKLEFSRYDLANPDDAELLLDLIKEFEAFLAEIRDNERITLSEARLDAFEDQFNYEIYQGLINLVKADFANKLPPHYSALYNYRATDPSVSADDLADDWRFMVTLYRPEVHEIIRLLDQHEGVLTPDLSEIQKVAAPFVEMQKLTSDPEYGQAYAQLFTLTNEDPTAISLDKLVEANPVTLEALGNLHGFVYILTQIRQKPLPNLGWPEAKIKTLIEAVTAILKSVIPRLVWERLQADTFALNIQLFLPTGLDMDTLDDPRELKEILELARKYTLLAYYLSDGGDTVADVLALLTDQPNLEVELQNQSWLEIVNRLKLPLWKYVLNGNAKGLFDRLTQDQIAARVIEIDAYTDDLIRFTPPPLPDELKKKLDYFNQELEIEIATMLTPRIRMGLTNYLSGQLASDVTAARTAFGYMDNLNLEPLAGTDQIAALVAALNNAELFKNNPILITILNSFTAQEKAAFAEYFPAFGANIGIVDSLAMRAGARRRVASSLPGVLEPRDILPISALDLAKAEAVLNSAVALDIGRDLTEADIERLLDFNLKLAEGSDLIQSVMNLPFPTIRQLAELNLSLITASEDIPLIQATPEDLRNYILNTIDADSADDNGYRLEDASRNRIFNKFVDFSLTGVSTIAAEILFIAAISQPLRRRLQEYIRSSEEIPRLNDFITSLEKLDKAASTPSTTLILQNLQTLMGKTTPVMELLDLIQAYQDRSIDGVREFFRTNPDLVRERFGRRANQVRELIINLIEKTNL
jgi:hypothetical protein